MARAWLTGGRCCSSSLVDSVEKISGESNLRFSVSDGYSFSLFAYNTRTLRKKIITIQPAYQIET